MLAIHASRVNLPTLNRVLLGGSNYRLDLLFGTIPSARRSDIGRGLSNSPSDTAHKAAYLIVKAETEIKYKMANAGAPLQRAPHNLSVPIRTMESSL